MEHKVVGFKEIRGFITSLLGVAKQFWIILLILSLGLSSSLGYLAYFKKTKYSAELSFMLNEDTGNSMNSALSAVLGKFSTGGGKYNLDKILELSKSRNINELLLFTKWKYKGEEDFIANTMLDVYKKDIERKLGRPIIQFQHSETTKFNLNESEQLLFLHNLMSEQNIVVASTNDKTGIMNLNVITYDEDLSKVLADTLFSKLGQFYINKSVEKELQTYNIIKRRSEYLYYKMNNQTKNAAQIEDASLGVWEQKSKLPQIQYERDSKISSILYGETLKNLELANFSLQNRTPFIQLIDSPLKPLNKIKTNFKIQIIIGIFISIFLYTIFCYIYLLIRNMK